ncbi:hypothetical protein [Nocardioides sp. GXZ039]|uniref:hypothetical protein n=1 Tax=Nocardioides sp. GXZ039 TaxID=3136018 RepID=UPI0030F49C4F
MLILATLSQGADVVASTMSTIVPLIKNPIEGIAPDFEIFGAEFTKTWQKLLAGVWGLGIIASIFFLIRGMVTTNTNTNGGHPGAVREGRAEVKVAAISLLGLALLVPLVGAILAIAG